MSEVLAWLVDLDGTLYRPAPVKSCIAAELALRPRAWRLIRAFRAEHEAIRREVSIPVTDPFRLQVERTAEQLRLPSPTVSAAVEEWMFRRPGKWLRLFRRRWLLHVIRAHRERGGRTALVSDYPALEKLAVLGATSLFDVLVASGEPGGPGRLKPWPDGYLAAAARLGVPPEACLVIGDGERTDREAAARAGITFRHVTRGPDRRVCGPLAGGLRWPFGRTPCARGLGVTHASALVPETAAAHLGCPHRLLERTGPASCTGDGQGPGESEFD